MYEESQEQAGTEVSVPKMSFPVMADADGDPRMGSALSGMEVESGSWVWDGAGLELAAVLPTDSKSEHPASAPGWASGTSGPPLLPLPGWMR